MYSVDNGYVYFVKSMYFRKGSLHRYHSFVIPPLNRKKDYEYYKVYIPRVCVACLEQHLPHEGEELVPSCSQKQPAAFIRYEPKTIRP